MTKLLLATIADARVALDGISEWVFGPRASFGDCVRYVYHNQDLIVVDDDGRRTYDNAIRAYLLSVGENPAEYSL